MPYPRKEHKESVYVDSYKLVYLFLAGLLGRSRHIGLYIFILNYMQSSMSHLNQSLNIGVALVFDAPNIPNRKLLHSCHWKT